MYLAIDFGTSNTKAALVIEEQLILVRDPFKPESSFFPSSVYLTGEGQILVGHAADGMRDNDVYRYRKEFKRDFGGDIPYQLGDRQLLPQDLLAAVLSQIKQEAGKMVQSHGENSLTKVVLTVPANYGDYKKRLMWKVAEQVGFTDVQFLPEPEAAAYYYNRNNIISNGDIVLVYDLGGGTFDAALLRKEGEGYKSLVPPTGIDGCGGIDFDRQIYQGMKLGRVGDIIEAEGVHVTRQSNCSLADIEQKLKDGEKVIVGINQGEILMSNQQLSDYRGIPASQGANHVVKIIGIDRSDPKHEKIILNDPAVDFGRGLMVPKEKFMTAWQTSCCYAIITHYQTKLDSHVNY